MRDISTLRKAHMFPALMKDRFHAFDRCDAEQCNDIYNILEDYGFDYEERYCLLDNIIEDVTGFNIENCKTNRQYEYDVPMWDNCILHINLTSDADMWHGYIEDNEEQLIFDSYVELFDWERESDEDMNTSRLLDMFELADENENNYQWDDIRGIL